MRYLMRRSFHGVLLLVAVSVLCFLFSDLAPGSFLDEMKLNPQISPQTSTALRAQYGLDQPLAVRYLRWVESVTHGEWGYSFAYNLPVSSLLPIRARNTLALTLAATVLAWAIAIPLGIWSAYRNGRWEDRFTMGATSFLLSVPELVFAIGLLFLAVRTHALPAGGMQSLDAERFGLWQKTVDLGRHLAVPVTALVLASLPILVRHVRASMIEVLDMPFISAARGCGIGEAKLLLTYAFPAAANPLISLFGLSVAGLLSGSLLVEAITGWPGLGPLLLEAAMSRDLYIVIGIVMLSTIFTIAGTLLADVMLVVADPRVRAE